ncbi:MAG: serine--tRNA ligase, partial [Bacteroidota bacterium]
DNVPEGKVPADNKIIREGGDKPALPPTALPHWDLIRKFDLVDFETGAKITGSGFPLFKGAGAKLQRALIQYFLDYNTKAGYTEYIPPFMVNEASAFATGQLPDKEGQMYFMPADNFYMIPTSEVPVTNIYRDTILKQEVLPVKMTAYSPCFRREAGSFGKDVRGLNRVHQFEKVEIIQITEAEKSYDTLEEMVAHVEQLLQALKLPYRILLLCGGDMSFTSALTYDFEVYSAAQDKWLEVSSVSNFESYQANRLKCRYRDENGKMQLVHTLNGSSLALPRIYACLLENNQTENSILLPEVLHTYMGKSTIEL